MAKHAWSYGGAIRQCNVCKARETYWDDDEYPNDPCPGQCSECFEPLTFDDQGELPTSTLCDECQFWYDESHCDYVDCDESLDDGEGYDGYCGTHADQREREGYYT